MDILFAVASILEEDIAVVLVAQAVAADQLFDAKICKIIGLIVPHLFIRGFITP